MVQKAKILDEKDIALQKFIWENTLVELNGTYVKVGKGVPQGSSTSPTLFNIYIQEVLNKVNKDPKKPTIQAYADDIVLVSHIDDWYSTVHGIMKDF